jgi:hypothetical protein
LAFDSADICDPQTAQLAHSFGTLTRMFVKKKLIQVKVLATAKATQFIGKAQWMRHSIGINAEACPDWCTY